MSATSTGASARALAAARPAKPPPTMNTRGRGRRVMSRYRRRRALAGDLGLFGQLRPDGLPLRDLEAELLAQTGDLGGESSPDLIVVTQLELVGPIDLISLAAWP